MKNLPRTSLRLVVLLAGGLLAGCSTLAEHDPLAGDKNSPNSALGPFREIKQAELGESRLAPLVLSDDETLVRDVSLLDADEDLTTLGSMAYAARLDPDGTSLGDVTAASEQIIFIDVPDGRSFPRQASVVLTPELPWEGATVGAPAALRYQGEIWLYYTAAGGIGLATSANGQSFTRVSDAPLLSPDAASWEGGAAISSPTVMRRSDGSFIMFYEVAAAPPRPSAIAEAHSTDGISWERNTAGPVLPLGDGDPLDSLGASSPCLVLAQSAEGRSSEQLYYLASSANGTRRIALAARFSGDAALTRAVSPVYGDDTTVLTGEPWVIRYPGFSLLFVNQLSDGDTGYPAVAAGVAPATAQLPPSGS